MPAVHRSTMTISNTAASAREGARQSNGEFGTQRKDEADVTLTSGTPVLPPITLDDVERLEDFRGVFKNGYTENGINAVFGDLESTSISCVWDFRDDLGAGGDSDFVGLCNDGTQVNVHPELYDLLTDPKSKSDPGTWGSLLSTEVSTFGNVSDMTNDGARNFFVEDRFEDDDECLIEDCDESLDDNEGYDGYCGTHADKIDAHNEGQHREDDRDDECPNCNNADVHWG